MRGLRESLAGILRPAPQLLVGLDCLKQVGSILRGEERHLFEGWEVGAEEDVQNDAERIHRRQVLGQQAVVAVREVEGVEDGRPLP